MIREKLLSHPWIARFLAGAVGIVFLTASLMKATDMAVFVRQVKAYGIITQPVFVVLSAWALIALQCALGVGLLVFYRPRLMLSLAAMLWLILLGGTSWAWITGATQDCGCYGSWLKNTPAEATIENMVLLALTITAGMGHAYSERQHTRAKAWAVGIACLMGLVLPIAFGFPISAVVNPQSKALDLEPRNLEIQGLEHIDLSRGDYLVVLIGTECLHCQETLPELDMLAEATDLPPVVALSANDEAERKMFTEKFQPLFPIGQISEEDFWRLLAEGELPRIMLLRNGHVQEVWDRTVPDMEEIKATENP